MMHILQYNFEDKVSYAIIQLFNYMMEDTESLDLCIEKSYYPEVFSCLFNTIMAAVETKPDFSLKLFKVLLNKISNEQHLEEFA